MWSGQEVLYLSPVPNRTHENSPPSPDVLTEHRRPAPPHHRRTATARTEATGGIPLVGLQRRTDCDPRHRLSRPRSDETAHPGVLGWALLALTMNVPQRHLTRDPE